MEIVNLIAECLSMRHIIVRGRLKGPTVEYACIYIYIYI